MNQDRKEREEVRRRELEVRAQELHCELTDRLGDGISIDTPMKLGQRKLQIVTERELTRCVIRCMFWFGEFRYSLSFFRGSDCFANGLTGSLTEAVDAVEAWLMGTDLLSFQEHFAFAHATFVLERKEALQATQAGILDLIPQIAGQCTPVSSYPH